MNAPTLSDLRSSAMRDLSDEKMDQVRELLLGDALRQMEARLVFLESRFNEVEIGIGRQLDALEARIEGFAGAAEGDRRATFEALARSVADLGEQIRRISRA